MKTPTPALDCHSPEFAAKVKAIFGRVLVYGDGPISKEQKP